MGIKGKESRADTCIYGLFLNAKGEISGPCGEASFLINGLGPTGFLYGEE